MASDQEKYEKDERARRLKIAREAAGIAGPKAVAQASDGKINENVYKAHESGRNGFTVSDARAYADLFDVSLEWLYLGVGSRSQKESLSTMARGEAQVKDLLRRIDGLPEGAIEPLWGLITYYLPKDADRSERILDHDQSAPPSLRR